MTAFYFGGHHTPLFGLYHAPQGLRARAAAVVICQPHGHEYIRCHRALRILGDLLARSGFAVLRFDYAGCGDSAGDAAEDGDLEQWRLDVSAAVRECRALSGRDRIAAVGLRLGASLALLAAQAHETLDSLVLWNPVLDGARYLDEVENLHDERRRRRFEAVPGGRTSTGPVELLGFSYPPRLVGQLGALDLSGAAAPGVERILLVELHAPDEAVATQTPVAAVAARAERMTVPGPRIWLERSSRQLDRALVPRLALDAIVRWLETAYP